MIKNSVKYIYIALLNLVLLTILLALWTDRLELVLNYGVRPFEFLKIIVFTVLSLIAMRILIYFFHKKNINNVRTKIKMAVVLTLLCSSYLYINYSSKIIDNRIVNGKIREEIAGKVKSSEQLVGTQAENLTTKEYQEISKKYKFPKLPDTATDINYVYQYDGFLPDYFFELTYDLPKEIKVDTFHFKQGDFERSQTVHTLENRQTVIYSESEQ